MNHIKHTIQNSVAIITLNRPEVLNSFNKQMAEELQTVLQEAKTNSSVRSILVTGEGRAFCAGQDLAEAIPHNDIPPKQTIGEIVRENYNPIIILLRTIEKPVVCAVNGVAAGAGANIALACDIVLASTEATFIQSFSKIGLIPDSGGTFFLPRLVGFQRATAMMMFAEKISAQQAYEWGMVYKVYESNLLLDEALKVATHLATQPTAGFGLLKRALNTSLTNDISAQLEEEAQLQELAGKTKDYQEGVKAFLEKRKPVFKGE